MLHLLTLIYSWPAFWGAVAGLALQRLYRIMEAWYGNRYHPCPHGGRYQPGRIDRVWIAGLAAALTVGYVLLSAERARVQTVELTQQFIDCQTTANAAIKARTDIAARDSELNTQTWILEGELDDASTLMMERVISPPPEIARLDPDDPRRRAWKTDVQIVWDQTAIKLRRQIARIVDERKTLDAARAAHPLPDFKC